MQFNPHMTLSRFIGRRDGRRVPGRVPLDTLYCELGPVIDLSTGGMRVLSTKPCKSEVRVHLHGDDVDVKLRARVAWTRRHGFRRHEIGLTFINVDDDLSKILHRMATDHRARHAV